MKKRWIFFTFLLVLIVFSSCAPAEMTTKTYGFLYGILHGILLPISVIGKIFGMDYGIYAMNNSGMFYWIGYLIGIGGLGGGACRSKC